MPWDLWLIFLFLAVVVPWRGRARIRQLMAKEQVTSAERVILYSSTIAFQFAVAAIVAWRTWHHEFLRAEIGLVVGDSAKILLAALLGAGLIGGLQWMNLRRVSRLPIARRGPFQIIAERILPRSEKERFLFLVLALTAGVCEEFLYRGFAMAALQRAGFTVWAVVAVSSLLFGLAHSYQGRGGIVGTLLVGLVFAGARIAYDSLIPVMVWHAVLDGVTGVAGPRFLPKSLGDPQEDPVTAGR
jgi:membrane protease YdiL (CAAX protease family)